MKCLDRKICPLCKLSLVNKIRFWGLSHQRKLNLPVSKIKELVSALRLPQVFYNQGLSSLRRSVSYVRAEH